jgi:putative transposase
LTSSIRRLGVGGRLAASRTNTNCIQSMFSIGRDPTRNVRRWRDGKMIKRWCAAGMLNGERSFRRLKGYRQMPTFVAALARHVEAVTPACDAARVA